MDIFSNLQVIGECLFDKKRVGAFSRAITSNVKKGDIVMDIGTGSGILALLSAKAGAKKVYAIEIAEDVAEFAKKNISANGFSNVIEVITADIKNFNFPKSVDIITAEMLDTCLVAEQQAQAINNLVARKIIETHTKVIPYKIDCCFDLVEYDFNLYGFSFPFVIQARNFGVNQNVIQSFSETITFKTIEFDRLINTKVKEDVLVNIEKEGIVNAIRLKSKTHMDDSTAIWGTTDMNMPVIIPVEKTKVKPGDSLRIHISYTMGEGFHKLKINLGR